METKRSSTLLGIVQLVFVVAVVFIALFITRVMKHSPEIDSSQDIVFTDSILGVSVTHPQPESFTPTLLLTGTVAAQTETQIAPQVNGRVVWVNENFVPGASVNKGETLFHIDDEDFQLALDQADAEIAAALSDLKFLEAEAKIALSEWEDLYPGQSISDLGARKPQIEAAQARVAAAEARKKTAELALMRTRVTSPAQARILSTSLDVGQLVSSATPVGTLYALENVEVAVPLSPDELRLLAPIKNRAVILTFANGRQKIGGKVTRLASVLDPRTRQVTAYIQPNDLSGLTIGSFVNVEIFASSVDNSLQVPITSLSGRNQVWVLADGQLSSRRITVLDQTKDHLIVTSFDIGEGVLTLPPADAFDGQRARVRSEER